MKLWLPYFRRPQEQGRSLRVALLYKTNNRIRVIDPRHP